MDEQNSSESAANPQPNRKTSHRGCAPAIRRLHTSYPELSNVAIAKRVGCTVDNVYDVLKRFLGNSSLEHLRSYQDTKADVFDSVAMRLVESVTDEKLAKMAPYPAVIGACALEDKARTIRGQATGINVSVLMDVAELIRRKRSEAD